MDLSAVRIHTGGSAEAASEALGARAFTYGQDVVFGAGQFDPEGDQGRILLAHELVHVAQQRQGGLSLQRQEQSEGATTGSPLVVISCPDMLITFMTEEGSESYTLTTCDIPTGDYTATVQVTGNNLDLDFGEQAGEGTLFSFAYSIAPGQRNPTELFKANAMVVQVAVEEVADAADADLDSDTGDEDTETETSVGPVASGVPLSSFVQPNATYAVAMTPLITGSGGYTVPEGLLAQNALAAQRLATAEQLVASQGLQTTATTVARGASLAEELTVAGEEILVLEAAGGGEVEAATGPPGWVVGAIVLVAAGGLIAAGWLLSDSAPATEARTGTQTATDSPTGDCTEERHRELQDAVNQKCKQHPSRCRPGMTKRQLKRNALRNERCMRARRQINQECYGGGNAGHQRAQEVYRIAAERCWDLYRSADRR